MSGIRDRDIKRIDLRLPSSVYEDVEQLAEDDYRSVHGELIVLIIEAVAARRAAGDQTKKLAA